MEGVVPRIVELLKDTNLWDPPSAVTSLSKLSKLRKCYLHSHAHLFILFFFPAEVVKEIEKMVPHVVDMLEGPDLLDRSSAVTALGEISKQRK